MSIAIKAKVTVAGVMPIDLIAKLDPLSRNKAAAQSVTYLVQRHLTDYNRSHPNQLGGKRTNHYRMLALATNFTATEKDATVAISDFRASMTILGGRVVAGKNASFKSGKPTAALTIPAHSESYGERAKKFDGKTTLIWFKEPKGKLVGMIVDAIRQKLSKGKIRKEGAITGGKLSESGTFKFKRVLYWLVTEAIIKGRRESIPSDEQITDGAVAGVRMLVQSVFKNSNRAAAVVYGSN